MYVDMIYLVLDPTQIKLKNIKQLFLYEDERRD